MFDKASDYKLKSYLKDTKNLEKVLIEIIDCKDKFDVNELRNTIDKVTQNQRELANNVMKKNLKQITKIGKYYNISKKLVNNTFKMSSLTIGAPMKFSEWQEFVGPKLFTDTFFKSVVNMIEITIKARKENVHICKKVGNIAIASVLINRDKK